MSFGKRGPHGAIRAVASALVCALALGGCGHVGAAGDTSGLHPWTKPDTVRIGFYEEPDTLNPALSQMTFSTDVFQLVFDGLIRFDDRGRPIPDLAREIPTLANGGISKDGRTLTYHLMPNARWHDGVPVTARDVIFTWHQVMNPANNVPSRDGYDRITAMDAPDPHTLRVHFRAPYPPAIYLFRNSIQGSILPEHILRGAASFNRAPFNSAPIGSGPYVFERWEHGSEMRFHANRDYFRGAPKIENVVVKFVPDQNTMLAQLRTHEVDIYLDLPPVQTDQIRTMPGIALASTATLQWEHLNFNTKRPPLDERAVRRALCFAVNEDAIFTKIYRGFGYKAPTHFNPEFGWGDPKLRHFPFNLARANAELDAAGWRRGPSGMRAKNGVPLAFSISTVAGVKPREAIEVFLQNDWHELGADVTVKNFPAATLFASAAAGGMLQSGKTDVALYTWFNETPDPNDEAYVGRNSLPPNGQNDSFYQDPEIWRLEAAGLATFDPAVRRPAYAAISDRLDDAVPEYVLNWLPEIDAANVDLHGVRPVPVGSDLWNIADWTFR